MYPLCLYFCYFLIDLSTRVVCCVRVCVVYTSVWTYACPAASECGALSELLMHSCNLQLPVLYISLWPLCLGTVNSQGIFLFKAKKILWFGRTSRCHWVQPLPKAGRSAAGKWLARSNMELGIYQ